MLFLVRRKVRAYHPISPVSKKRDYENGSHLVDPAGHYERRMHAYNRTILAQTSTVKHLTTVTCSTSSPQSVISLVFEQLKTYVHVDAKDAE